MAWLQQRGKKWGVGWYTLAGVGRWRSCPTKPVARRLKLQIESAVALGRDWEPDRPREAAGLEEVFRKYLEVRSFDLAQRTLVRYGYALDVCLQFARDRVQGQPKINVLSRAFLEDYRIWLSKNGTGRHAGARSFATVVKLTEPVELAWNWAEESERWPDVPRPQRLGLKQPRPRHAVAASFDEYDGMLGGMLETIRRYPRLIIDHIVPSPWLEANINAARHPAATSSSLSNPRPRTSHPGSPLDFRCPPTRATASMTWRHEGLRGSFTSFAMWRRAANSTSSTMRSADASGS